MNENVLHTNPAAKLILVVDDSPDSLELISSELMKYYEVHVATGGERCLELARRERRPDLILLDVMMPGMDGYEVCRRLKANPETAGIPVLFLTGRTAAEDESFGLEVGAEDYLSKPVNPAVMMARVRTHLRLKAAADYLRDQNLLLESEVARRLRELSTAQDITIYAMATLAETRDDETGNHIYRTQNYVRMLATKMAENPKYGVQLPRQDIELLYKSAPLHDIGKIGIPDRILLKPGRLSPEEFEIMKTHAAIGKAAIRTAEQLVGVPNSFLRFVKEIAGSHHEKWDGSGYPEGLAGEAIPLSARLMALADVYDALISKRVYKEAFSHEVARNIIVEGSGRHFDPAVVEAFLALEQDFIDIAQRFSDNDSELMATTAAPAA
ncbi:MAG: response regulator [Burkholderiales bacterium]